MLNSNVWEKSRTIKLDVSNDILPEMNIGFDDEIPDSTRKTLCDFVEWVEEKFTVPITLWVDFEYKHYLISREGKRVGYLFYWSDFSDYPHFTDKENIPEIRLPVRTEHSTIEEILGSFIEALTDYYAWICNDINDEYNIDESVVDDILQKYLNSRT